MLDLRDVFRIDLDTPAIYKILQQIRNYQTVCTDDAWSWWDQYLLNPQVARHISGVKWSCSAKRHQTVSPGIMATLYRYRTDRPHHVGNNDIDHALRGPQRTHIK